MGSTFRDTRTPCLSRAEEKPYVKKFSHLEERPRGRGRQKDGAVRPTAHLLHLPGPVPDPQAAALSALVLPGPLHGGAGRLCQTTGQMSGVQGGAQDPIQRDPGVSNKLPIDKIPGTPC